jgi:hypothetical protein
VCDRECADDHGKSGGYMAVIIPRSGDVCVTAERNSTSNDSACCLLALGG